MVPFGGHKIPSSRNRQGGSLDMANNSATNGATAEEFLVGSTGLCSPFAALTSDLVNLVDKAAKTSARNDRYFEVLPDPR